MFSESHDEHGMFKIPSMCIPGSSSTLNAFKCQSKHEIWEVDPVMHKSNSMETLDLNMTPSYNSLCTYNMPLLAAQQWLHVATIYVQILEEEVGPCITWDSKRSSRYFPYQLSIPYQFLSFGCLSKIIRILKALCVCQHSIHMRKKGKLISVEFKSIRYPSACSMSVTVYTVKYWVQYADLMPTTQMISVQNKWKDKNYLATLASHCNRF